MRHHLPLLGTIAIFIIAVASCNTPAVPQRLAFKSGIRAILQDSKGNMWSIFRLL